MATPLQVAQSVVDTVSTLTVAQRLRIRNQWTSAWDAHVVNTGAPSLNHAGWLVHHEIARALDQLDPVRQWATLAERARARWEADTERDPLGDMWACGARFAVRDTIRAVLLRDSTISPALYTLLTAGWRDRFPGFDA